MAESEVARLRREIADQYIAAKLALEGFAVTARHDFITAKMQNIAACHQELVKLVGEQEATKVIADTIWEPADRDAIEKKKS
jgi:cytochrome c551/c552